MARIAGPHGGPEELEITLRRSARARRLSLRVSGLDGTVTLTLPPRVAAAEGLAFARERADWIVQALARVPQVARVAPGALLPVEGVARRLEPAPGRGPVRLGADTLQVPGDPAQAGVRVAAFLRALARDRLVMAVDRHAAALGRAPTGITLRDTRSRWGSCTAAGGLMFNWRLVMAPPAVLDYVAAHEVAHLAEMNHSPRYWAVVARLLPGYEVHRRWLKAHGGSLHGWRFTD
jgi:predicted metal-dependent hydrolase